MDQKEKKKATAKKDVRRLFKGGNPKKVSESDCWIAGEAVR